MKPSVEHERLARFVGRWEGEEHQAPSPWGPGGPARGVIEAHAILDGLFVAMTHRQSRGGVDSFQSSGLLGWDPERHLYASFVVDSFGFVPAEPARGPWEGDAVCFSRTTPRGQNRQRFAFEGDGRLRLTIETSFDGGATWSEFLRGTYERRAT